jgi:hypothetical protein
MRKSIFVISLIALLSSCGSKNMMQVTKPGSEPEEYKQRAIYVLPQTVLSVKVEFEKETYIPGPFRLYTEKFLGLKDFITEPGFSFRILNVDVQSFTEPDPEEFYSLNIIKGEMDWHQYLRLSEYGFILDPLNNISRELAMEESGNFIETPFFTDLSVKRNLTEVTDTLYKTIISDSSYVRVPVLRKQREAKTIEQKAEEAANFIIKIRKRRFKLLAGQYDVFPEGRALAISVEELDKLEKEYLELFIGKRIKQTYRRSFLVTPGSQKANQNYIVARFSPLTGVVDPESSTDTPLNLEIVPLQKLKSLSARTRPDESAMNTLIYRIPDIADVSLSIKSEVLYQGRMQIYQMGEKISYPVFPTNEK